MFRDRECWSRLNNFSRLPPLKWNTDSNDVYLMVVGIVYNFIESKLDLVKPRWCSSTFNSLTQQREKKKKEKKKRLESKRYFQISGYPKVKLRDDNLPAKMDDAAPVSVKRNGNTAAMPRCQNSVDESWLDLFNKPKFFSKSKTPWAFPNTANSTGWRRISWNLNSGFQKICT